jgi:PKD repeat protein
MQFLNIDAVPVVTLTPDATEMCEGTTVNFTIDCTNVATSYWDFGDGVFEYHLSPTSLSHTYNTSGLQNIMVIVQSLAGCQDTLNFPAELLVHPIPTASFLTNTISADITYPYFEFYNNSINATAYYWNFGDGSWSNDVNPTYVYQNEGEYLATLTATNQYGCVDQTSMLLAVDGIQLYVPNAFTPLDYDGINDVFKPSFSSTGGIDYYELIIFDRWGLEVFKTNDIDEGWIGNSKEHLPGEDNYYAQNDAYIWQISYRKKAKDGEMPPAKVVTGHVMILR